MKRFISVTYFIINTKQTELLQRRHQSEVFFFNGNLFEAALKERLFLQIRLRLEAMECSTLHQILAYLEFLKSQIYHTGTFMFATQGQAVPRLGAVPNKPAPAPAQRILFFFFN